MKHLLPFTGTALLALIAGGLGILAWSQLADAPEQQQVANSDVSPAGVPTTLAPKLIPARRDEIYYQAITDRPLFAQTRRPVVTTPVAVEPEPEEIAEPTPDIIQQLPEPNVVLLGVLTGGARNAALIALEGAEPKWLRDGDEIAGWTLGTIRPDSIELSEADRVLRIDLYRK